MARVFKRGKRWYVDYTDAGGRRVVRSVADTRERAEMILSELKQRATNTRMGLVASVAPKSIVFFDFVKIYLDHCKVHNVNWRDKRIKMEAWKRYLGDIPLSAITAQAIGEYQRERLTKVKTSTINRYVGCLRAALNLAVQWGYLTTNPMAAVKQLREPGGRLRFLDQDEIARLVAHCNGHLHRIVLIALYTGMRMGEILKLETADCDLRQRVITVRDTKDRGLTRFLPIHSDIYPAIRESVSQAKFGRLFPYRSIRWGFNTAVARAGLENVTFHTLRHTFASQMTMAGCDPMTLAKLMGHSSVKTTMRYSHLAPDFGKLAVGKLKLPVTNLQQSGKSEQRGGTVTY